VVLALGATEQHGPHLPLATDSLLGDHLARAIAERLEAFYAPTVRIGCSSHHLGFPGTLSIADETFHRLVGDLVRSLAQGGFRRVILLPSHGGNFAPLAGALEGLGDIEGIEVVAVTDLSVLFRIAQLGAEELDVPLEQGGIHAGEWETSMLASIHPDLVDSEAAEPGYLGPLEEGVGRMFEGGMRAVADNGVFGDPRGASSEHGRRYWDAAVQLALEAIESQSR